MSDHSSRCGELRVGSVVRSAMGRDRKRVFLVTEMDCQNRVAPVVIANGSLHKIEDRKHKNPAHLRLIGALSETEIKQLMECPANSKIAEICERFDIS